MLCRHKTPFLALEGTHGPPVLFRGNGINSPESKSALRFKTGSEFNLN